MKSNFSFIFLIVVFCSTSTASSLPTNREGAGRHRRSPQSPIFTALSSPRSIEEDNYFYQDDRSRNPSKSNEKSSRVPPSTNLTSHPLLGDKEIKKAGKNVSEEKRRESSSLLPISPFITSNLPAQKQENIFSSTKRKEVERRKDFITYEDVLRKTKLTDDRIKAILQNKGVSFEEFINFIDGGATMEMVNQILHKSEISEIKPLPKNRFDIANNNFPEYITEFALDIDSKKKKSINNLETNKYTHGKNKQKKKFNKYAFKFDVNSLPSKDSPLITHFRKPEINTKKDKDSAAIVALSIEEKQKPKKIKSVEHQKKYSQQKYKDGYQSDQPKPVHTNHRIKLPLTSILIVCGIIAGLVLFSFMGIIIYSTSQCSGSPIIMAEDYQLHRKIDAISEEEIQPCTSSGNT